MTASADKIQFLLQSLLQQTLPLLKKGIFSQHQLRCIMLQRQKHENKLYSSTFKLSHFLKAIQFEYDLQRKRIYKIKSQLNENGNINPIYKKQSKTDFTIIKRILKLWDRTMHKYRYRTYLWKQYLAFCIVINSKKHFYKALTNSLRFLPFQIELWKIGIRYQVEIGKNKWKARKLFHKALRLIPAGQKNIKLTEQLIKFQLQFVQTLQLRQNIIKGQGEQNIQNSQMKFIMGDNRNQSQHQQQQQPSQQQNKLSSFQNIESLRLRQYDQILFIALQQSIMKNIKSNTYFVSLSPNITTQDKFKKISTHFIKFLEQLLQNQNNELISHILIETIKKVKIFIENVKINGLKIEQEQKQGQNNNVKNQQIQVEENYDQIQQQVQIQQNYNNNHNIHVKQQKSTKIQQSNNKKQPYQVISQQILSKYEKTQLFDQKLFTRTIKQYCLKPLILSRFLQPLLLNCLTQCLSIFFKNQWLRVPLPSLTLILSKISSQSNIISLYFSYITRQINKINVKQYEQNLQLLRQIIRFYKQNKKIQENNKIFRSIIVNCKNNVEFIEKAKCMFTQ